MPILILPLTKNKTKGQPPQVILLLWRVPKWTTRSRVAGLGLSFLCTVTECDLGPTSWTWTSVTLSKYRANTFKAVECKPNTRMLCFMNTKAAYKMPLGICYQGKDCHILSEKGWYWWSASEALTESLNLLKHSFCRVKGSRDLEVKGFYGACTAGTIKEEPCRFRSAHHSACSRELSAVTGINTETQSRTTGKRVRDSGELIP